MDQQSQPQQAQAQPEVQDQSQPQTQQQPQVQQQPQYQPQMAPVQQPKKKHTGLIVVIVILCVFVLGGLVSCFACGAAVNSVTTGSKASNVAAGGSKGSTGSDSGSSVAAEEIVLYDGNGVSVKATERGIKYGMAYYTIEIVNSSDQNVNVNIDKVSANGKMISTFFHEDVAAGKSATESLTFSDVHDMDELTNVEGTLRISNDDNYKRIDEVTFKIS